MTRLIGPRRRRGRWSPEEAANELHRRRGELIEQLRRRSEARGIPNGAQEEIVDDAITAVVMSPRGIANENHLVGAFWLAVDHRCRRHREGRHLTRLGSRRRVGLEFAVQQAPVEANPFDALELIDRLARAADLMAELDERERQVLSAMASRGVGAVSAARLLGLPLSEVRSAARSARIKLDRVAVIYAAGRMCEFRAESLVADAAGRASEREAALARAHVKACIACGRAYRRLRREMRTREFQRAAAAAFLPLMPVPTTHIGGLGKLAIWIEQRVSFMPRGSGGRAAEVLGGAGIVKAAAAGTAVVAAGGALSGHVFQALEQTRPRPHHLAHVTRAQDAVAATMASADAGTAFTAKRSTSTSTSSAGPAKHTMPKPPSKSLTYLAIGAPAAGAQSSAGSSEPASREPSARAASAGSSSSEAESTPPPAQSSSSPPTQSGGGTGLGYLGR